MPSSMVNSNLGTLKRRDHIESPRSAVKRLNRDVDVFRSGSILESFSLLNDLVQLYRPGESLQVGGSKGGNL